MATATKKQRNYRYVWRYTTIPAVIDILRRRKLPLLNPERWDDRNDRYFMKLYKQHQRANGLYAMCGALVGETYHHWRVFSGGRDGACIVFKRRPLECYLQDVPNVRFKKIKYIKIKEVKELQADPYELPFLKRWGFRAEEEYRVIVETGERQEEVHMLNLELDWIDRIYINPWLPRPIAQSVIDTLRQLDGCEKLDLRFSRLTDSSTWKAAGDRIAGITG